MFKKFFVVLALLVSTSGYSLAVDNVVPSKFEVPIQKIEGGEKPIEIGEPVILNLSKITNAPKDYVSYSVEWKVYDGGIEKKFYKNESGNGIFFGSGTTKRKVIVFASVSYLYVVKDGDKFVEAGVKGQFLTIIVDIGGDGGGNVIPPGPNPNPDPTFNDGQFKLAAKSYKSTINKVVSNDKRAIASLELSKSFAGKAAKIAATMSGNLTAADIKKILEETTADNREALKRVGVSNDVWDAFFVDLQQDIFDLYSSEKLKTGNDFATAWREISEGLSKVK